MQNNNIEIVSKDKTTDADDNNSLQGDSSTPKITNETTLILIGRIDKRLENIEEKHYIEFDWKNWKQYPFIFIILTLIIFFINHYKKKIDTLECKQRKTIECFRICNLREYMIKINECEK